MDGLIRALIRRLTGESGQALAEYGLILALVFVVSVVAVTGLGLAISGTFTTVAGLFP